MYETLESTGVIGTIDGISAVEEAASHVTVIYLENIVVRSETKTQLKVLNATQLLLNMEMVDQIILWISLLESYQRN